MSEEEHPGHTGKGERLIKERRSGKVRRKNVGDRRDDFRFGTEERRSGEDRRKGVNTWKKAPDAGGRKND